jgi:hypothetical protein
MLLADLESQFMKLERSRPRTPGKKGAKTRALNKLSRRISAARGRLTKSRNAIAKAARTHSTSTAAARLKRSAAAKKGWASRLRRLAGAVTDGTGKFMPMLTKDGVVWVNPVGDDRSLLGVYWTGVGDRLNNMPTLVLQGLDGLSIVDSETGARYPFITDMDTILAYHEHFDFGPSFYKSRGEAPRLAA